jgi:hypothetical protein
MAHENSSAAAKNAGDKITSGTWFVAYPDAAGLSVWYCLRERSVPRMNTKNSQNQKKQRQTTIRQEHGPKKQDRNSTMHHDHELPETRMTR